MFADENHSVGVSPASLGHSYGCISHLRVSLKRESKIFPWKKECCNLQCRWNYLVFSFFSTNSWIPWKQGVSFQERMKKSKVVRDISQIKKCPLHVCGQECTILVFKTWNVDDFSWSTLIVSSLPTWAVLCTHHPALPPPKSAELKLQGLSQPWPELMGSEPHRSAVLGTKALSTHQHLLLLSAW